MTPPMVWFDVTETLASGRRTGIQRVTIELARELLQENRGTLIRYDFRNGCFVLLTAEETNILFGPAVSNSIPRWHSWVARLGLNPVLGVIKDLGLALSLFKKRGQNPEWRGGTYATAEVLGNVARYDAVRRLQRQIPTVLVLHDLFPLTEPRYSSLRRQAFARHWNLCRRATQLVAVSEHTRQEATRFAARVRHLLPPIVVGFPGTTLGNGNEQRPTPEPEQVFFLCVGTLEHRKNQAGLLKAYRRYRSEGGRAQLILVGGAGPGTERLVRAITDASGQGVRWYRRASDESLTWLYRRALALVYPSRAEGFGLPLVEALAVGTPCITSNRTSTAEVAALCGGSVLVDPDDELALARALRSFDLPGFREQIVETIRRVQIPTWRSLAGKFAAIRGPLKLLLDVSSLGYGALGPQHRTGLFRVAAAYAQELRKHPGVQLGLYASSGNRLWAAGWVRAAGWKRPLWVGSALAAFLCLATRTLEFAVFRSVLRPITPLFGRLRGSAERFRAWRDKQALTSWQAYLSPMEAVPLSIRGVPGMTTAVLIHDLIPLVLPGYRQDPSDPTRWFSALWKSILPTDLVFTVSEATRQDWLRLRPDFPAHNVTVALNAVDSNRFHAGVPPRRPPPYFLTVSTVEPRKRLDATLEGYRAYRRRGGTTPLAVVGHDKDHSLTACDGVELLGFVREEELPGLYSGCTAFLSLSEYEGFGLPILEAMSCGAPVVVSDRSSHPEVAGKAALYVNPDDVASVVEALVCLDNPQERKAATQRSLAQAARFRWDQTIADVVERMAKEGDQK